MKQLRSWHLSALKVISEPMSALARTSERDCRTRTTNENCMANESWTRTKYVYDDLGRVTKTITPEAGTVCFGTVSGGTCNADGYDSFSNLLKRTDARGVLTT